MFTGIIKAISLFASVGLLSASGVAVTQLEQSFRDQGYKNIAFVAGIGGSSHVKWVLSILEETASRGHNVSFLTSDNYVRFGRDYPSVRTISTIPSVDLSSMGDMTAERTFTSLGVIKFYREAIPYFYKYFEQEYTATRQYFQENNIDLAVCDHFSDACFDAANSLNIPYVITSAVPLYEDTAAPYINNDIVTMNDFTTEFQSLYERFTDKFIMPIAAFFELTPANMKVIERKRALGIPAKLESPDNVAKNALKIYNIMHGFSAPRPTGPLVEYIGPIIPQHYQPLTPELEDYLSTHNRVAYVAFGQMATPTERDIRLILTSLLESIENGYLDGLLWASVNAAGLFPDTITTRSNTTYNVQDMFNGNNPDARVIKWAPQTAVLNHPNTLLFVSHGGLGSWYESMYSGTRMVMFPFFGDQPGNSLMIDRAGLGGILNMHDSVETAVELFKNVAQDKDGKIMGNVKRYQALVQVHSKNGVERGANLIEEVVYTHKNGTLPHRESADKRMSFIKSHNLDLYAILALLLTGGFSMVFKVASALIQQGNKQKLKVL